MYKLAKPLFLLTETPMHAGSGDDLGVVDLPIQRERHTKFPKIEASSLKGAIREAFEGKYEGRNANQHIMALFGPEDAGNDAHAGALAFTDARLLLFPVKSMKGVFAWITCPRVLERLKSDLALTDVQGFPAIPADNRVCNGSNLLIRNQFVALEEFTFPVQTDANCTAMAAWLADNLIPASQGYWRDKLRTDLIVLSDNDFTDFVQLSTEVITRIKINNETGTVADGALFTEEYLPAESVLYSLVFASKQFLDDDKIAKDKENDRRAGRVGEKYRERVFQNDNDTMAEFANSLSDKLNHIFQIGGNATLGKGIVRAKLL